MKKTTLIPASRVLCGIVLFSILSCSGVLRGADVPYPPEPQQPNYDSMTSEQRQAEHEKWWAARCTWESNLTVEQYLAQQKDLEAEGAEQLKRYKTQSSLPEAGSGYDWGKAASGKKLNSALVGLLKKQKIGYGESVKQSFQPYLDGPVFITTDSLLNGFHVLFEDSFRELESREAGQFAANLAALLKNARALQTDKDLSFPPERYRAALRHAQLVLGPAIVLMGGSLDTLDRDVRGEVSVQMIKIRRAEDIELPSWLAPADASSLVALDYRRCKPVGFYASDEKLAAYFRAVRWLQMVPFRGSRIVEMDAAVLLGLAGGNSWEAHSINNDFRGIARFVGPPDDPAPCDLIEYSVNASYPPKFANSYDYTKPLAQSRFMEWLIGTRYYEINSDLRLKTSLKDSFANVVVRLIPAARLQDAVLFQRLIDAHVAPSGLAFAAMLQSPFAEQKIPVDERQIIERARKETLLKVRRGILGGTMRDQGLQIYERYLQVLKTLFLPPAPEAPDFMRGAFWKAKSCQTALAGWAQMRHTFTLQAKENEIYLSAVMVPPGFVEPNPEFFSNMAQLLETVTFHLEANGFFTPSGSNTVEDASNFRQRWDTLKSMAYTLANLANKQLRKQPWTDDEAQFLKGYGTSLAFVMGYFGNSYDVPRDDAPRWVEVARDPQRDTALAVAVGRPRYLYVLYPWNGMEILCQGSVMQYYEYDAKGTPLTDTEWLKLLDSPDAPPIPDWLRPYADAPWKPDKKH